MHQSQGSRNIDICIIHACIRIKDHGNMYHGYMHHGYMHHGYMHHGYMYHGYMHQGYMHHGYMHHIMDTHIMDTCIMDTWVTRPERPKGAKDEVKEARATRGRPVDH